MSALSKKALKTAKGCIDSQDWAGAEAQARQALSFEPQNYFANVFLGLSLFNQKNYSESEQAYREAVAIEAEERQRKDKKENAAAWQGLVNLYEVQQKVDEYMEAALKLACIYMDQDDRTRCQTAIDKIIPFVKEFGTKAQHKKALHIILPGSQVFEFLEGVIPHPAHTYGQLAEIIEAEEKEKINKEIANRRSRLNAVIGQVTVEVRREVLGASPLESLYQNILNWSDNEETRREIDCKLLRHGYDKLLVLPPEQKLEQKVKVQSWARGLVILKHPYELAWQIVIEWRDCESLGEHDVNILREYIEFFPESGRAIALKAYMESEISPFPAPKPDENGEKGEVGKPEQAEKDEDDVDPRDHILEGLIEGVEKCPASILCHRILGEYYLLLEEYESAVDISRTGRKLAAAESQKTGLSLQKNQDAITITLATALIHYQSPKHHTEARAFFENVLKRNSTSGNALVGLGLILEEQEDYAGATELLRKALARDPENVKISAEAAWCDVLQGRRAEGMDQLEKCLQMVTGVDARARDMKALILWRIGAAMWDSDLRKRSDRNGAYSYFIAALQNNQNFAPAYTSLGIFFADVAKDSARATKCFQRAFELSPGEVEAAERLARSFAESKEWELVEIVARRVAEADKKRSVAGKTASWPQSAIGVVELNSQNYTAAIRSFQTALKSSPDDFDAWLGLGEAYASSGQYTAALKVFTRAQKLHDTNWFAKYMLANVRRELGEHELAIDGYQAVLELKPKEFGVLVALSETLLASASTYVEQGFYGRAVDNAVEGLNIAQVILQERPDAFNLWKTVGDACILFSWVQDLTDKVPKQLVIGMLEEEIELSEFDIFADVDEVGASALERLKSEDVDGLTACLWMGILAYKRAIYATADDRHAHAVAWFNLGCAEYRTYVSRPDREKKYRLAAIRCFKRTIKLEPGNHEFWNALGIATAELNPKIAQHALVRALYINDKNARVWTNLGALYIIMEDYQLANEAFSKSQSTDPEYPLAWIGQGLVAAVFGEPEQAQELFEHAFEISEQSSVPVKRLFATATFDTLVKARADPAMSSLLIPLFALEKLEGQLGKNPAVLQLSALFDERVGDFSSACRKLGQVCTMYEERYEETEAEKDLVRFAHSKADLARMHLGLAEYAESVEHATMALDLSGDIPQLGSCRLSAHLTAGLAQYYIGAMDESLEMFRSALTESQENPDVICVLSQVLWAKGGEDERDVAREQLFASVENHPNHLQSILLLGAIGVLDDSPEVAEAVADDLRAFRTKEGLPKADREKIDNLLTATAQLSEEGEGGQQKATAAAASAVFLRPALSANWHRLAEVAGDAFAAEVALRVAQGARDVDAVELSRAYAGVGKVACDLKAIFIAPWKAHGWKALEQDVAALA